MVDLGERIDAAQRHLAVAVGARRREQQAVDGVEVEGVAVVALARDPVVAVGLGPRPLEVVERGPQDRPAPRREAPGQLVPEAGLARRGQPVDAHPQPAAAPPEDEPDDLIDDGLAAAPPGGASAAARSRPSRTTAPSATTVAHRPRASAVAHRAPGVARVCARSRSAGDAGRGRRPWIASCDTAPDGSRRARPPDRRGVPADGGVPPAVRAGEQPVLRQVPVRGRPGAARPRWPSASPPLVPTGTEVLAGLELGGVPVATALVAGDRAARGVRAQGGQGLRHRPLAEGADIDGRRVLVVEDVITTGGQVVLSTGDLRERGAIVDTSCASSTAPGATTRRWPRRASRSGPCSPPPTSTGPTTRRPDA